MSVWSRYAVDSCRPMCGASAALRPARFRAAVPDPREAGPQSAERRAGIEDRNRGKFSDWEGANAG